MRKYFGFAESVVVVGMFMAGLTVAFTVDPVRAASLAAPGCTATVGNASTATLARSGAKCVLTFSSGVNSWTVPASTTSVRVLVVGGGGAGGQNGGGGGGGGQVIANSSFSVTPSSTLNVSIGAAGASPGPSDWNSAGGAGGTTTFDSLSAVGGGGGGTRGNVLNGQPGFSGGGGGGYPSVGGAGSGGGNGGNGFDGGCDSTGGGGGGASGAAGNAGAYRAGGNGGAGVASDITGTPTFYGGGGAGGGTCDSSSGQTWSGTPAQGGAARASQSATPNSGGGGGGGGAVGWAFYGGNGGSGVVILSWNGAALPPTNTVQPAISGTTQKTSVLTATTGTWSESPTSYVYKWKRSTSASGTYVDIPQATASSYTLSSDDVGSFLKVEVTASNAAGSVAELSTSTAVVTDLPNSIAALLGTPSPTADGFTFRITNVDLLNAHAIALSTSAGSVSRTGDLVTVTGLGAGASATVAITTSRTGYNDAVRSISGTASPAPTTTSTPATSSTSTPSTPPTSTVGAETTSSVASIEDAGVPSTQSTQNTKAPKSPTSTVAVAQSEIAQLVTTTTTALGAVVETAPVTPSTVRTRNAALPDPADPAIPAIPNASPGMAAVEVDGKQIDLSLSRSNDQLVVTTAEVSATIFGVNKDGTTAPLDSDGVLRLAQGDQVRIEAAGFALESEVEVWLFSDPTLLGRISVGVDGKLTGSFPLPDGVNSGSHRIALVGVNAQGDETSLAVGVLVGASSSGVGSIGKVLIAAPIVVAVFAALVLPARRRRKIVVR